jgi:hypothetical protein
MKRLSPYKKYLYSVDAEARHRHLMAIPRLQEWQLRKALKAAKLMAFYNLPILPTTLVIALINIA